MDDQLIFRVYERSIADYSNHGLACSVAPDDPYCFCHTREVCRPIDISNRFFRRTLDTRAYVAFGEACYFCNEPIWHRRAAYLTDCCSTAMHKLCTMRDRGRRRDRAAQYACTVCGDIDPNDPDAMNHRYWAATNGLDRLENHLDAFALTRERCVDCNCCT